MASKNSSSRSKRICVIDPNPIWLNEWERNFQTLGISFLRSPALAHCSYFDQNALLAYAISEGREDELLESGCSDIKSLKGTILPQVGLWKLPSTKLFIDFSRSLAKSLPHDYFQGNVVDTQQHDCKSVFNLVLDTNAHQLISTKSVILATGAVGSPVIPQSLKDLSSSRIVPWQRLNNVLATLEKSELMSQQVLVVGGGLTAVQTAQKIVNSAKDKGTSMKVVICSRRCLVERHFDIPVKWFDEREARFHQSQFYHESETQRLEALQRTRGGGTVPPFYMKRLHSMEKEGVVICKTGDISIVKENDDNSLVVCISQPKDKTFLDADIEIKVDAIVLACGLQPDCFACPLVEKIQQKWPRKIIGGFPVVSEDLMWTENMYVVGGLASLSVGPDASNIMGILRAAETVANALNSKKWLRDQDSNVLRNPFEIFQDDTDASSDEEDNH